MSSLSVDEVPIGQYVKLQEARDGIDFVDDLDDEELITMVKDANDDLETELRPYADLLPLPDGSPDFKAAARAGLLYVKARWKEKKHNFELAKVLDTRYEKKLVSLKKALESKPHERTKALIIGNDPRNDKLPLPTQYDNFVFDDFA